MRPIVRGKTNSNVEFGAKILVSLMNGYTFLDDLSWEAFKKVPVSLIIDKVTFSAYRFFELLIKIRSVSAATCKNEKEQYIT